MTEQAYIEHLRLCPLRPAGTLRKATSRLVELLQDFGAIEPVVVRKVGPNDYEILSNVETWMAAQRARIDRVPIHVLDNISDEEATEITKASFAGFEADPIDEAEYFQDQLDQIEEGGSRYRAVSKLAHMTGHTRTHISHSIRLLKLPIAIQEMVRNQQLSVGHATALVSVKPKTAQLNIANQAISRGLSVRAVRDLASDLANSNSVAVATTNVVAQQSPDPDILRLQHRVAERVGCPVKIDVERAHLTLEYYSLDILEGVLEKLGVEGN